MTAGVRASVRCTTCPWTGQRKDPGAKPCPECGSRVVVADRKPPGRKPLGLRAKVTIRPLVTTVATLGPEPAKLAAVLDEHAAALVLISGAMHMVGVDSAMLNEAIARDIEAEKAEARKREAPDIAAQGSGPGSVARRG